MSAVGFTPLTALHPRKEHTEPNVEEAGWAPEPVWTLWR